MRKRLILLLAKKNKPFIEEIIAFIKQHFDNYDICLGARGDNFPVAKGEKSWNFIISYLSPWIVPPWLLDKAKIAAINFHPGPPEYPGIGCTNFAIYDRASNYGVTSHHMSPRVDAGKIIAVRRFPVHDQETVHSLTARCYAELLELFFEIMGCIFNNNPLPESKEIWRREAYTRGELDALCEIKQDMDPVEVGRRIKATTYPNMPGAFMMLGEKRLNPEQILGHFSLEKSKV